MLGPSNQSCCTLKDQYGERDVERQYHPAHRVIAVGWETAQVHRERLGDRAIDVIPNAVEEGVALSTPERQRLRDAQAVES